MPETAAFQTKMTLSPVSWQGQRLLNLTGVALMLDETRIQYI
jgi:hypothetical protein